MRTITFYTRAELEPMKEKFGDVFSGLIDKITEKKYLSDLNTDDLIKIYEYLQKPENQDVFFAEARKKIDENTKYCENYIVKKEEEIIEQRKIILNNKKTKNILKENNLSELIENLFNVYNS